MVTGDTTFLSNALWCYNHLQLPVFANVMLLCFGISIIIILGVVGGVLLFLY